MKDYARVWLGFLCGVVFGAVCACHPGVQKPQEACIDGVTYLVWSQSVVVKTDIKGRKIACEAKK